MATQSGRRRQVGQRLVDLGMRQGRTVGCRRGQEARAERGTAKAPRKVDSPVRLS